MIVSCPCVFFLNIGNIDVNNRSLDKYGHHTWTMMDNMCICTCMGVCCTLIVRCLDDGSSVLEHTFQEGNSIYLDRLHPSQGRQHPTNPTNCTHTHVVFLE